MNLIFFNISSSRSRFQTLLVVIYLMKLLKAIVCSLLTDMAYESEQWTLNITHRIRKHHFQRLNLQSRFNRSSWKMFNNFKQLTTHYCTEKENSKLLCQSFLVSISKRIFKIQTIELLLETNAMLSLIGIQREFH